MYRPLPFALLAILAACRSAAPLPEEPLPDISRRGSVKLPTTAPGRNQAPGVVRINVGGPSTRLLPGNARRIVDWLADPARRGRRAGTPGGAAAGEWLAAEFSAYGLEPGAPDGGWFQPFDLAVGVSERVASLTIGEAPPFIATLDEGFAPLAFSADGRADANVHLVGHGISAPDLEWDDWDDDGSPRDLAGGVAVIFRGLPDLADDHPLMAPESRGLGNVNTKIQVAKEHGASAVLFVDPLPDQGLKQPPGSLRYGRTALPSGLISWGVFARLFPALGTPEEEAVAGGKAEGPHLSFQTLLLVLEGTGRNVVGRLEGPEGAPLVVLGAHYDHLGLGEEFSMSPKDVGEPHVGADDNASGTALVLEVAHHYAGVPRDNRPATIIFALFDGEEMGLLGSRLLATSLAESGTQVAFMINADMVGRLADSERLLLGGRESATEWEEIVALMPWPEGLEVAASADGSGRSDHVSFYATEVPSLFLFTGAHADYHKPSDTADKVDFAGIVLVARAAIELIDRLSPLAPFTFQEPPARASARGSYGPWFGSVPDFAEHDEPGYWITDTSAGSPAEKAGLQGGDRVVMLDGREVADLYGFTAILRTLRPGDEVEVVVMRSEERLVVTMVLGRRE
ncbi:M28 family peptidase [bacterium]|nr:M28 family peptidase [bacterium]